MRDLAPFNKSAIRPPRRRDHYEPRMYQAAGMAPGYCAERAEPSPVAVRLWRPKEAF